MGFMILKVEKGKHPEYDNLKPMMPTVQLALEEVKNGVLVKVHSSGMYEIHGLDVKQKQEQTPVKEQQQEVKQEHGIRHSR
jgi:hypothetical protein